MMTFFSHQNTAQQWNCNWLKKDIICKNFVCWTQIWPYKILPLVLKIYSSFSMLNRWIYRLQQHPKYAPNYVILHCTAKYYHAHITQSSLHPFLMQCSTTAKWFEGSCPFSVTAAEIYNIHYFLHVSERDGRVRELNYIYLRKEWTRRQNVAVREKNIQHPALMSRQNSTTTPSHQVWWRTSWKPWTGLRQLSDTCMKHSLDSAKHRVKRVFCGSSGPLPSFPSGFLLLQLWYGN